MSEPKFTPGPWRVLNGAILCPQLNDYGNWIVTSLPERGTAQDQANADLISAAPDLYKALRSQVHWRMRDGSPCCCPLGEDEDEPKGEMPTGHATNCEELRAALAKAEGKAAIKTTKPKRVPKTELLYVIQGHYPGGGWEDVDYNPGTPQGRQDALVNLKLYYENEKGIPFRLITRRVKIIA
jgi:hypothetical protein